VSALPIARPHKNTEHAIRNVPAVYALVNSIAMPGIVNVRAIISGTITLRRILDLDLGRVPFAATDVTRRIGDVQRRTPTSSHPRDPNVRSA
jgi:hypothetical protein